jgi:hypothetical protein
MFRKIPLALVAMLFAAASANAQTITIDGVTDRTTYTDSATFRVQTNGQFTYFVTLNGVPVPAGVSNTITRMDYYDLAVTRSNAVPLEVTNTLVRFHVLSSQRGSPERGLIAWLPYPPISSTAAEFAGANLEIVAPKDFPQGLDIPIIARVADNADNERRANGWVSAPGFEASAFRLLRGHGHGFLPRATNSGTINYNAQISSLQSNKQINIEPTTTWTSVSGALMGTNIWGTNSRISVTGHISVSSNSLLRVLEGAVVRCMPGVTITNLGRIWIEGTTERPVVFTATNRVAPEVKAGAWGGFWMRTNGPTVEFIANGAIMTGSGAGTVGSFAPGGSHKSDQPLLFLQSTNGGHAYLTNCYLINNAGQIANGYNFDVTYDHCLLQRAITSGESVGGTIILNHSAVIEFPAIDGVVTAAISDGDYDAIYFTLGTHILQNSLFGFCKDDAIDSGSGGAGTVLVSNCWVESALHEALAWSGGGRVTWTYDSVLMNSGQGIECGWSTGANSPLCYASNILSLANSIGARYGDNYTPADGGLGTKTGHLWVSNSYLLYNYRDVFGRPWDTTWNWRTNDMDVFDNFLTASNPFHPNNSVWNPLVDGAKLATFMSTPPNAPVGIGLALWNLNLSAADLTNGIPVRLSSFTTNTVSIDYVIETPATTLVTGSLTFLPCETVKNIFVAPAALGGAATYRVALQNPQGGELTDARAAYALPASTAQNKTFLEFGSPWKYLDNGSEQGTAWRGTNFPDSAWSNGIARLGFGPDAPATTTIRRYVTGTSGPQITNFYFRTTFVATNLGAFTNIEFHYQRDDGCIVYLNGNQIFTNNMPLPPITANTFASTTISSAADALRIWTNSISPTAVLNGTNLIAVEVHQSTATSSDISWECEVQGVVPPPAVSISTIRFGSDLMLNWTGVGYVLEQADEVTGPWTAVPATSAPATIELSAARKFYRLKK